MLNRRLTTAEFEEIVKCRNSPKYFINNYCMLRRPMGPKMPFNTYRYQDIVLDQFLSNTFNIILKARQMGLSWLVAAYSLWLAIFFEDKSILMISIKDKTAKALLKKVKILYNALPDFLKFELEDNNMSRMAFCTGGEIESVPTSEEAGRSDALSLLIIDEAAYVRWLDKIWASALPTLSTGGSAIILSTPNGMGNYYYDLWNKSVEGKSLFNPIRLHWWYHPDRDANWLRVQKANMHPMQVAQEFLGDFIASGNLVLDAEALRALQDECAMIQPIEVLYPEVTGEDESCGLHIFEKPSPKKDYLMPIDLSQGVGGDYNAAHVIDKETGLQVAEYRSKLPLNVFNSKVYELGMMYNHALAAPERNSMGIATVHYFQENDYPRMYEYADPMKRANGSQLGFPTNSVTRPILIDKLQTCIQEGVSGIQGIRTVNEMLSFAWSKKGKAEAQPGKHDDLVISYGIGRYVREMASMTGPLPFLVA